MRQILVWLLAALALIGASAAQADYPARPDGPVLDAANIIPDQQEASLDARLRAYSKQTGRAVIVATVTSLDDLPVEDYAQTLAEKWDIGGKETEQGVLILVAPNERRIRIHANRGVQERLPDVILSRITRDTITPKFKAGDFGGGIAAGVDEIVTQLDRDPADAKAVAEAAEAAAKNRRASGEGPESVIFWIIMILFFMLMFGRRRRGHGYRRSGIDPGIVLWGLSEIAHHASRGGGGGFDFGSSSEGGGFGGFGGGGGGFDGGGASGSW